MAIPSSGESLQCVFSRCCKLERMMIKKQHAAWLHFDWGPSCVRWHTAVALCAIVLFMHKHCGCLVWLRDEFISKRTHTHSLWPETPQRFRHTKQDAKHGGALVRAEAHLEMIFGRDSGEKSAGSLKRLKYWFCLIRVLLGQLKSLICLINLALRLLHHFQIDPWPRWRVGCHVRRLDHNHSNSASGRFRN